MTATKEPAYRVSPCDEDGEDGNTVRTWDVMLGDRCMQSGIRTRAEARAVRDRLREEARWRTASRAARVADGA